MGKSVKKSASKVAAVVAPAPAKPLKKGKREAEGVIEKEVVSAKKQKVVVRKKSDIKVDKKVVKKKKDESSDDSDSLSDGDVAPVLKAPTAAKKDSDSDSDEEVVPAKKAPAAKKKDETSDEESSEEDVKKADSSDEESGDEEPQKKKSKVPATKASKKQSSSEEDSDEDSEDEEDKAPKTPKKNDTNVKTTDACSKNQAEKTPNTPKEQSTGSKTLFVGNLSYSVEQTDIENFFKPAGEVASVRFSVGADNSFKGYVHVEFATHEEAVKALQELNGHELLGRAVRLDLAQERQHAGDSQPFQKPSAVFVHGFDKYEGEDQIRSSLQQHFASCGEITRISIPPGEDGGVKGIAFINFKDPYALTQALELNGSDLGNSTLSVEEAKPRGDGGGRGRGRSGRGRGGRGRSGDSGRGRGRFGDSGRGGRGGRGNFNRR